MEHLELGNLRRRQTWSHHNCFCKGQVAWRQYIHNNHAFAALAIMDTCVGL